MKLPRHSPDASGTRPAASPAGTPQGPAPVRLTHVPQGSVDDIIATLGRGHRSWLGTRPKPRPVSAIELYVTPQGLTGSALVGGKRKAIEGHLSARLENNQRAMEAILGLAFGPLPSPAALRLPPCEPTPAIQIAPPSPSTTRASSMASSPPSTWPSSGSLFSLESDVSSATSWASSAPGPALDDGGSATLTAKAEPEPALLRQQRRWALYCDAAATPGHFATEIEIFAAAQTLNLTIQILQEFSKKPSAAELAHWPVPLGDAKPLTQRTARFDARIFAPQGLSSAVSAPTAVALYFNADAKHYEPVVRPLPPNVMTAQSLQSIEFYFDTRAVQAALRAAAAPVPSDGACFFHSLAAVLPGHDAATLRQQTVAWLRADGGASIPANGGLGMSLLETFMPDSHSTLYAALMAQVPEPESP